MEIDRLKARITALKNVHWAQIQWMESQPGVAQALACEWEAKKKKSVDKAVDVEISPY